jgi:transposase
LLLRVFVSAADQKDRDGAKAVLSECKADFSTLQHLWADGNYTGSLIAWGQEHLGATLEIVKRCDDLSGFVVLPRRWVVERTFAWLGRYRRLGKDYELLPAHSEAMIYLASIRLMLNRLQT